MDNTYWRVTRDVNDYNQEYPGTLFIFSEKPEWDRFKELLELWLGGESVVQLYCTGIVKCHDGDVFRFEEETYD